MRHEHGAWPYQLPAWVLTTRELPQVDGDVRVARGDVRAVHDEMTAAAGGKDRWVVGGGDLAGQFADAGLLDELIVYVAPVTLGGGAPLLPPKPWRGESGTDTSSSSTGPPQGSQSPSGTPWRRSGPEC